MALSIGKKTTLNHEYIYHKNSGKQAVMSAFIFLIAIETIGLQFLLAHWTIMAAWIFTGLSIYTALQVLGMANSLSRRPISINTQSLTLRYGIVYEVDLPFSDNVGVELSQKSLAKDKLTKTLSPLGAFGSHKVILRLKQPHELTDI